MHRTAAISLAIASLCLAQPYSGRGFLTSYEGCFLFEPFNGDDGYVLDIPTLPDTLLLAAMQVSGDADSCSRSCGGVVLHRCISQVQMTPCEPESLGCGILSGPFFNDETCWLWTSTAYGRQRLHVPPPFASGDTVTVSGWIYSGCGSYCMVGEGCLWKPILHRCSEATPTRRISWGTIRSLYR